MNGKQLVKSAIANGGWDRIPVYLFNKDVEQSDIVSYGVQPAESFRCDNPNQTEWGFVWEHLDDTMGQPKEAVIKDWSQFDSYCPPDGKDPSRLRGLDEFIEKYKDKYIIAGFGITGFGIMTFLRGFENTLEDFYLERENIEKLADMVFGYEEDVIRQLVKKDIDAVSLEIPMPFTQYAPQARNLEFVVPCESRTAGVIVYYPLSMCIMTGI